MDSGPIARCDRHDLLLNAAGSRGFDAGLAKPLSAEMNLTTGIKSERQLLEQTKSCITHTDIKRSMGRVFYKETTMYMYVVNYSIIETVSS